MNAGSRQILFSIRVIRVLNLRHPRSVSHEKPQAHHPLRRHRLLRLADAAGSARCRRRSRRPSPRSPAKSACASTPAAGPTPASTRSGRSPTSTPRRQLTLRDAAEGDQRQAAGRRVRSRSWSRCRRASTRTRTRCGRCTATSSTTAGCKTRSCGGMRWFVRQHLDAEAMAPGGAVPRRPARLPLLRDGVAEPADQRADDHAPGGEPLRRVHLDRRGGGRLPVQHGAGHRRDAGERRPRLLAGDADRGHPEGDGPPPGRPDRPARGAVPDARDVSTAAIGRRP